MLDLNGVVKGRTVDDALPQAGADWVNAGGDLATRVPLRVEVPGRRHRHRDRGRPGHQQRRAPALAARRRGAAPSDRPGDRPAGARRPGVTSPSPPARASRPTSPRRRLCCSASSGPRGSTRAGWPGGSSTTRRGCASTTRGSTRCRSRRRHEPGSLVRGAVGGHRRVPAALRLGASSASRCRRSGSSTWPRFAVEEVHRFLSLLTGAVHRHPRRLAAARPRRPVLARAGGRAVHLLLPAADRRARRGRRRSPRRGRA